MKFTIRLKLLTGFFLLLILSLLVQGFVFYSTSQYIYSQIVESQKLQADKGASEIQKFFTELRSESFSLANIYQKRRDDIAAAAYFIITNDQYIRKITILSPLGHELLKFDTAGEIPKEKLSYEVFSDPFHSAVAGTTAISKVYYIESLGPHIDFFSPIFGEDGHVDGVMKMQVNLTGLNDVLKDIKLGENGYIYVVDNEGSLIAHPTQSFVLARPNLSSRPIIAQTLQDIDPLSQNHQYINEKQIPVIAQAVKSPGYNWVAVFEQPTSEAFGFLMFIRNLFITTIISSTIILLILALVLSESLTRPIRKLERTMQEIEKGKHEGTVIVNSGDEIESLSKSFASLLDKLVQREDSLRHITIQLEKANDKLKTLDKLKNEFVSLASHELRTPMSAIRSYLWMVLKGKEGALNERQLHYLQRSYNSVDRLIRLVNDMLNISRIESGKMTIDLQSVDLIKLTQEVVDDVTHHAQEAGVVVYIEKPSILPPVLADPDKIKEVIFNLIGNALKFTPKGGSVTIRYLQKDDFIETSIIDTGVGIEPENIGKLFQRFGLLPGSYITNQTNMGSGLGLYICRSIIDLHQGSIKATSEGKGKGMTIAFTLKLFKTADLKMLSSATDNEKEKVEK